MHFDTEAARVQHWGGTRVNVRSDPVRRFKIEKGADVSSDVLRQGDYAGGSVVDPVREFGFDPRVKDNAGATFVRLPSGAQDPRHIDNYGGRVVDVVEDNGGVDPRQPDSAGSMTRTLPPPAQVKTDIEVRGIQDWMYSWVHALATMGEYPPSVIHDPVMRRIQGGDGRAQHFAAYCHQVADQLAAAGVQPRGPTVIR